MAISEYAKYAVAFIPVLVALSNTIAIKQRWRDKWSVCTMAATQLTFEIYKFRMMTLEYDVSQPPAAEGEEPPPALSEKERSRVARNLFVERIQAFYTTCMTEMSQGSAIQRKRPKVSNEKLQEYRTEQENRPTLAEWLKIRVHVEKQYYDTQWSFPSINFLNWISGLRPYVQQRTVREELRTAVDDLVTRKKLYLNGEAK